MMQDAYLSKVPDDAFANVVAWLGEVHARFEEAGPKSDAPTSRDLRRGGPHLVASSIDEGKVVAREEAFMFGTSGLLGILCEPVEPAPSRTRDAVIFLNVGSNHRVGSNRMYVKMARTLAARGITSLRFDVSGIGDSLGSSETENRLYRAEAVQEAQAIMTELTSLRDIERFYLVGLCSGAYLAFKTACADPRVAGQVLINAQTFSWKQGDTLDVTLRKNYRSTRFYAQNMWKPTTWKRVLRGEVNARGIASTLAKRALQRAIRSAEATLARMRPGCLEIDNVAVEFKEMLSRGTETLLVFGANDGGLDHMEAHLGPNAKKLENFSSFQLQIVEGTDHTFTPLWSQRWLEKLIVTSIERWRAQ
jgi:pimeloyl-ACP methyl ester carboxylesterase